MQVHCCYPSHSYGDSEFARSVNLLCFHNKQEGSPGFILNRPLEVQLQDILDIDTPYLPLYSGGPVARHPVVYSQRHPRD